MGPSTRPRRVVLIIQKHVRRPATCRAACRLTFRRDGDALFAVNTTPGTQDVNDPSTARAPCSGPRHGVVHVLGSVSALIGTLSGAAQNAAHLTRGALTNSLQTERLPREPPAHDSVRRLLVIKRRRVKEGG